MRYLTPKEKNLIAGGRMRDPGIPTLPPVTVTPPPSSPGIPTVPTNPGHGGGGGGGDFDNPYTAEALEASFAKHFDIDFIHRHEQSDPTKLLTAYVPADKYGKPLGYSGVTIGYGLDLGQFRSKEDLYDINRSWSDALSDGFIDSIAPYLNLKDDKAQAYLSSHPLQLDPKYQKELDLFSTLRYEQIIVDFEKQILNTREINGSLTPNNFTLEDLPKPAATAIADLVIQYGPNPHRDRGYPEFYKQIIDENWTGAINNLKNFGDDYHQRREDEANLLESAHLRNGEW